MNSYALGIAVVFVLVVGVFLIPGDSSSIPPTPAWKIFNFNDTVNTAGNVTSDVYNDYFEFESDSSILFNYTDGTTTLSGGSGTCGVTGWYSDDSWTKCIPLSVNSTFIDSAQTGFPLYVNQEISALVGDVQADGDDILFTDSANSKLSHELVSFNSSNGHVQAWVNATSLSDSADTEIKLFYGNSGASDQSDPDNVWTDAVAVYHFEETGTHQAQVLDSTSNNNDGFLLGTTAYPEFDGISDIITVTDESSIQNIFDGSGGQIFATIMPKSDGELNVGRIFDKRSDGFAFTVREESNGFVKLRLFQEFTTTNGQWDTTNAIIPLNIPTSVLCEYDSDLTTNDPICYIYNQDGFQTLTVGDGLTEFTTPVGTRGSDIGNDLIIGNRVATDTTFDGGIYNAGIISTGNGESLLSSSEIETLFTTGVYNATAYTAFYPMDEISGTEISNRGAGSAGSGAKSGTTFVEGQLDYGDPQWDSGLSYHLDFDGVNDYVDFGDDTDFEFGSSDFSIGAWVILNNYDDANGIFMKADSGGTNREVLFTTVSSTGELRLITSNDGTSVNIRASDNPIPLKVPVHVGVSKSGTSATFYVNGVAQTDDGVVLDSTLFSGTAAARSGNVANNNNAFEGKMHGLVVYKGTTLSESQWLDMYTNGTVPTTNLVLDADFDEGSGNPQDNSASANHGTNNGATWTAGRVSHQDSFVTSATGNGIELEGTSSHVRIPYDPTLSFGDGVDDDPFSIISVVNMDDTTTFRIINNLIDSSANGYLLSTTGGDNQLLATYVANNYVGRQDTTGVNNAGSNISFSGTYDGSELSSGFNLYEDGTDIDNSNFEFGSYTAMGEEYSLVNIGGNLFHGGYADGTISEVIIYDVEKSADFMSAMHYNTLDNESFLAYGSEVEYSAGGGSPVTTSDSVVLYVNAPQNTILGGVYNFTCSNNDISYGINSTGHAVCEAVPVPTINTRGGIILDTCPTGQYMRGVNSTGGLVCDTP